MSDTAETLGDSMRETAKEARKAARDAGKVAGDATDKIQADLEALRNDVMHLAEQLGIVATAHGGRAWNRAKSNVGDMLADAEAKVRQAGDQVTETIDESLQTRPYTTLAIAAGLGFLVGASWRR